MFYVLQNESTAARRRCPILLTDSATGTTGQSGIALTNIYPYVSINGGAFAGGAGTIGAVNFGQYYYEFDASEINTLGLAGIHITAPGCRDYDAIVQVAAFNMYSAAGAGLTAGDVWSYGGGRTTTGGIANTVTNPVDVTTASMTGIANTTWDTDVSAFTSPSAGYDVHNGAAGAGISAYDVWNFVLSDTSTAEQDLVGIYSFSSQIDSKTNDIDAHTQAAYIANSVWSDDIGTGANTPYGAGTAGSILYDLSLGGSGLTAGDVWEYDISAISTAGTAGSQLNLAASPSGSGLTAGDVWDFVITGFGQTGSAAQYTTQTLFNTGNIETYVQTQTPQDIWTYAGIEGRTITGGIADTVTTLTNRSGFAITGGTITTVSDKTGYSLSSPQAFDLTGNITGNVSGSVGSVTGAVGSVTGAVGSVTGNVGGNVTGSVASVVGNIGGNVVGSVASVSGNIGGNVVGSVASVSADVNVSTASMSGIANSVWSTDVSGYTSPSAGFDLSNASSGSGISAYDVWNFGSGRTITGGIADTVTSVTNPISVSTVSMSGIANTVWNTDISAISTAGTAGSQLNLAASPSGSGLTAGEVADAVWNAATSSYTSNGTFGHNTLRSDNAGVAGTVSLWTGGAFSGVYADAYRIDESYVAATALKDILTGVGSTITGNITGDLSGSVGSVTSDVTLSVGTQASIANSVWSTDVSGYTSPSAGYDLSNATAGGGITAGDVWSYATREITGGIADTVTTVSGNVLGSVLFIVDDVTLSAGTQASIANSVWSTDVSGYTSPSAGFDLSNANAGGGITAGDVWTYATRTITGGIADTVTTVTNRSGFAITGGTVDTVTNPVTFDSVQYAGIASSVWNAATRTLTSGSGLTAGDVWSYGTRTITGGIADTVTTLTNRSGFAITGGTITTVSDKTGYSLSGSQTFNMTGNITGSVSGSVGSVTGNVGGNVVGSVASVTNPVTFNSGQYAAIASSVWNAGTRTLTSSGSGISAFDVWNFVLSDSNTAEVDLVQAAAGSGLTAGDVWTYGTRTITGGIADTVTSVTNGVTVTTNNDKTGYALSGAGVSAVQSGLSTLTQAQVGTEVDSSLSDVGLTSTVTGRIDVAVSSRLASSSYTAPPTTAAIAGTVWSYNTRTLTSGAGASAGDIWTYATRTLTSGAGITVNAATNIINGPYFVKSNVDGQDGTLDVIRGMVQDIQLTVTDAFQNPFDTTALGLAVNFYDQAGTLTTSYATTELYGPAGLVQFTLDTAVTGVEGRYNLILSAAGAGNTIKFGPLQTLVRPF